MEITFDLTSRQQFQTSHRHQENVRELYCHVIGRVASVALVLMGAREFGYGGIDDTDHHCETTEVHWFSKPDENDFSSLTTTH
jgi:hypothetical protein